MEVLPFRAISCCSPINFSRYEVLLDLAFFSFFFFLLIVDKDDKLYM